MVCGSISNSNIVVVVVAIIIVVAEEVDVEVDSLFIYLFVAYKCIFYLFILIYLPIHLLCCTNNSN